MSDSIVYRIDTVGRLDGKQRTPQGGYRVDANLTRTGIFIYRGPNGETVREYRPPEEVFNEDSLRSMHYAPVTIGHPAMVDPKTWKKHAVGVVGTDARADGQFVAASLVIQDEETIEKIDRGELIEISMGYSVKLDHTPGVTPDGERYDAVQRGITYNHSALLPKNTGRAGNEVRLRLDSKGHCHIDDDDTSAAYRPGMTIEAEKARPDKLEGERDALKSEAERLRAENEQLKKDVADLKTAADKARADAADQIPALVAARAALESSAKRVLGDEDLSKKTDSEIVTAVLVKDDPEFKTDGRSTDYLRSRFDMIVARSAREDSAHRKAAEAAKPPTGAPEKSRLDTAIDAFNADQKKAYQAGPPEGALVRK